MSLVEDLILRITASGGHAAATEVGALRGEVDKAAMAATGFGKNMSVAAVAADASMARSSVGIRGHLSSLKSDIGAAGGGLSGAASVAFAGMASAASSAEARIGASMGKIRSHLSLGSAKSSVGKDISSALSTAESAGSSSGNGALAGVAVAAAVVVAAAAVTDHAVKTTEQAMIVAQSMHAITGMSVQDSLAWSIATNAYGVNSKAMAMSLKLVATQATAAEGGSKSSIKLFNSMGISMADLHKTGGDMNAMYQLMIDRLNKMPAGAQKTADAGKLLGRNWTALLPLLSQGSQGISQVTDLMKQFGLKTSGDTVKDMDKFHKAQIKMKETSQVLQMVFAEKVIPVLVKLLPTVLKVAAAIGTGLVWAFHAAKAAIDWVKDALHDAEGWINRHGKTWQTLGNIATSIWHGIVSVVQTAWPLLKGIFTLIVGALKLVWGAFQVLWTVAQPILGLVVGALKLVGTTMLWLWNNVISPVAKWIGGALGTIGAAFSALGGFITALIGPIQTVLNGIQSIFDSQTKLAAGSAPTAAQWRGILSSGNPNYISPPHGATGAIVTRPTLAWVGDKGPEKVVPLNQAPGASPLSDSPAIGAGHTVENHITFQVGAREFARAVVYSTGKVKATT